MLLGTLMMAGAASAAAGDCTAWQTVGRCCHLPLLLLLRWLLLVLQLAEPVDM
jgi:hypothetical protein